MTKLRDHPDGLAALVSRTSEATGTPAAFVDKDFWVVELLRSVSATSFSSLRVSVGQRDRLLKAVCERAAHDLALGADLMLSAWGVVRNVRFGYPPTQRDRWIREGVLLEMGTRGNPDPYEHRTVRSYVASHATGVLAVDKAEYEEFATFTVTVLRPELTLVEKLSLVHHLATLDPAAITASDKGRHLYDICRLLGDRSTPLPPLGAALWPELPPMPRRTAQPTTGTTRNDQGTASRPARPSIWLHRRPTRCGGVRAGAASRVRRVPIIRRGG